MMYGIKIHGGKEQADKARVWNHHNGSSLNSQPLQMVQASIIKRTWWFHCNFLSHVTWLSQTISLSPPSNLSPVAVPAASSAAAPLAFWHSPEPPGQYISTTGLLYFASQKALPMSICMAYVNFVSKCHLNWEPFSHLPTEKKSPHHYLSSIVSVGWHWIMQQHVHLLWITGYMKVKTCSVSHWVLVQRIRP